MLDRSPQQPRNRQGSQAAARQAALPLAGQVVPVANRSHSIHLDQPAVVIEHVKELIP
jgi:hypothetical protein